MTTVNPVQYVKSRQLLPQSSYNPKLGSFAYNLYLLRRDIHTHTHTYIIDQYKPSVKIIDLVSHTTYVVCINLIYKWRDLQFKVDYERQIF